MSRTIRSHYPKVDKNDLDFHFRFEHGLIRCEIIDKGDISVFLFNRGKTIGCDGLWDQNGKKLAKKNARRARRRNDKIIIKEATNV